MEIVSSSNMLRKFRNIKEFTMDLGTSKTGEARKEGSGPGTNHAPGQVVIKIKDPFVKRYSIEFDNYITKMGNIGTLGFYVDNNYSPNKFKIFDENKIYDFTYEETKEDIRTYLSKILDKIFEEEINPIVLDTNMEENIVFEIDKNLSQEEFLRKNREMRQKMDSMNIKLRKG